MSSLILRCKSVVSPLQIPTKSHSMERTKSGGEAKDKRTWSKWKMKSEKWKIQVWISFRGLWLENVTAITWHLTPITRFLSAKVHNYAWFRKWIKQNNASVVEINQMCIVKTCEWDICKLLIFLACKNVTWMFFDFVSLYQLKREPLLFRRIFIFVYININYFNVF